MPSGQEAEKSAVPRLYLVATRELFDADAAWLEALERVAEAAVAVRQVPLALQLRFAPGPRASELAQEARHRVRQVHATLPLWLNARSRADATGFSGLHVPEDGISHVPKDAMRRGSWSAWAASVHSVETLRQAQAMGARFALFGAVWQPQWKEAVPQGIESLRRLTAETPFPILAIGGITPDRVQPCLQAGAAGVAVASGIFRSGDVREALRRYVSRL